MTDRLESSPTQLCLHLGWPRTGTTSLQALLSEYREPLAAAGIVYPTRWRRSGHDNEVVNHNGLVELLESPTAEGDIPDVTAEDFQAYVRAQIGETMLLSSEELISWRVFEGNPTQLSSLLASFRAVGRLSCVTTIRRVDDLFSSLYLHHMLGEQPLSPPERYFRQARSYANKLITAMSDLLSDVDASAYVRYQPAGAHQDEILKLMKIPDDLRAQMVAKLSDRPRLNSRLTRKAVTALLHRDAIATRAGVHIDSGALRQLYWSGKLKFEDDMPCELFGVELRRSLHEEALDTARRVDFTAYLEFFEQDEVVAPAPTPPDIDVLCDGDIDDLVTQLAAVES